MEQRSLESLIVEAIALLPPPARVAATNSELPVAKRDKEYWGFISYSHADSATAVWLHRALERYRIPSAFVGKSTDVGPIPKRLKPFFRDEDEFAASLDLGERINQALDSSRFLLVVCTPAAARSKWVNQEITRFRMTADGAKRVLCLIADGEPHAATAGRPDLECFPPALFTPLETRLGRTESIEPLAADIRPGHDTRARALIRLVAGIIDETFDKLWNRERRRWRQQVAVMATAAALVLGVIGVSVWRERAAGQAAQVSAERAQQAEEQRQIADAGKAAADKEARINALTAAYESERDPLIKVQLASEMPEDAETPERLAWLHGVTRLRPPLVEYPGTSRFAALSPDGTLVLTASDTEARLSARDGRSPARILKGEGGSIWDATFTTDSRTVVTASNDGVIRLWDAQTGELRTPLKGHQSTVYTVALSNDGRWLVSGSHDHTARIWRLDSDEDPKVLSGHQAGVGVVAISPDASLVVTGSSEIMDHTARVWRIDGTFVRELPHGSFIRRLVFSRDGSRLLSVADGQLARLWSVADWSSREIGGPALDADFSPDGTQVAIAASTIALYDLTTTNAPRTFDPGAGTSRFVRFSPDGTLIVAASQDGQLRVWPVDRPWDPIELSSGTRVPLTHAEFDSHGYLLGSSYAGPARLWDLNTSTERIDLPPRPNQRLTAVANSAEPGAVATISSDGQIEAFALEGARATRRGSLAGVDATFGSDGTLFVLDANGTVTARTMDGFDRPRVVGSGWSRVISRVSFRSRGHLVVDRGDHAALWRPDGKEEALGPASEIEQRGIIEAASTGTSGAALLVRARDKLLLWHAGNWFDLGNPSPVPRAEFDAIGTRFVMAGPNLSLEIRSVDTPEQRTAVKLSSPQLEATAVAFAPNGRAIVAGLMLGSVQVVSLEGGDPLTLRSPRDRIDAVGFSPDGRRLIASASREGVSVWPLLWRDLLQLIRHETTACLSVDNRVRLLGETPADAGTAFTACERRNGRVP